MQEKVLYKSEMFSALFQVKV